MSLAEIVDEIPRLFPAQRKRVAEKIFEIEGGWICGDDELTAEEKRLLEARVAEHDRDPSSAVPWEEAKARLRGRFIK